MTGTIGDHEFAPFGSGKITLVGPSGPYALSFDEKNQGQIWATVDGKRAPWPVYTKGVEDDGSFVLSGMTSGTQVPWGDTYWFELVLGQTRRVDYWGEMVLVRSDSETSQ